MQKLKLSIRGIYTDPNTLSAQPEGALAVADNLVIDRAEVAEVRRGRKQYNPTLTDPKKLFNFRDTLLALDGSTLKRDTGAGTWASYSGSYATPGSGFRVQALQAENSFFFTSDSGIQWLDSPTGSVRPAGAPVALELRAQLPGLGGSVLPSNNSVAYRVVWKFVDANGALHLSAPSGLVGLSKPAGVPAAEDPNLSFTIPAGLTTEWSYQVYRSLLSGSSAIPGSDELYLAFERQLTAPDLAAGYIDVQDTIPEASLGAALYTNATAEGIAQSNFPPPFAHSIAEFKGYTFYLNIKQKHRIVDIALTSTFAINDTVTLAGRTYTAKAVENIAAREFSQAGSLTDTLISLLRVINRDSGNTSVYGYYAGDLSFYFERRDFGAGFTLASSNPGAFSLALPATSVDDAQLNGLAISKLNQPGSVPIAQIERIGRADRAGIGLASTRDALFIAKRDGAFRLTGFTPSDFTIEAHDNTLEFNSSESIAAFENTVFGSTNKGIISMTVNGTNLISLPIQNEISAVQTLTNFVDLSWAAVDDGDRKYFLGVPASASSTDVELIWVYNAKTDGWTRWPVDWRHALTGEADGKVYSIRVSDGQVLQERKSLTTDDFVDDEFPVTISSFSGADLTLVSAANAVVGMAIRQSATTANIIAVNGNVITVDTDSGFWAATNATLYTPIQSVLKWSEEDAENPGILKRWVELTFFFQRARFSEIDFTCSSSFKAATQATELISNPIAGWGAFPWGSLTWGTGRNGFLPIRTYFPREVARASWVTIGLTLNQCFKAFACNGCSVMFEVMSSRFKNG